MEVNFSKKQQEFIDAVMEGKSIFLTGEAGSGKSFVVREVIKMLKEKGKQVLVAAPTGIAANNLDGQTIHSLFGIPPFGALTYESCNFLRKEKRRVLDRADVIFIDEISMVRCDVLDGVHWTLKKNQLRGLDNYQVVFVGDLSQLEPVADDNFKSVLAERYKSIFFYEADVYSKLNISKIELDEVKRQSDPEFISALNKVRRGERAPYFRKFFHTEAKGVVLAPRVNTVNRYNEQEYNKLEGKEYEFEANVTIYKEGSKISFADFNVEPLIKMKDGAKIMYLVNSQTHNNLKNGTLGTFRVKHIDDEPIFFIEVNGVKYRLDNQEFLKKEYVLNEMTNKLDLERIASISQMPIKLAYAISIHKSQGMSIPTATIDLTQPCFAKGQLYVALSRVISPEGLRIIMGK